MIQQHHRGLGIAPVFHGVSDGDGILPLTAGDHTGQMELMAEDLLVADLGMDIDILRILGPVNMLAGSIADGTVKRKLLPFIHTAGTGGAEAAGGQKACGEALQESGPHIIVVSRRHIAVGRKEAHVVAFKNQPIDIGAAVCGYGKLQTCGIAHLQQAHTIALAAYEPYFLHAAKLAGMTNVRIVIHNATSRYSP